MSNDSVPKFLELGKLLVKNMKIAMSTTDYPEHKVQKTKFNVLSWIRILHFIIKRASDWCTDISGMNS